VLLRFSTSTAWSDRIERGQGHATRGKWCWR
jgi:hypothetical protein